MKYYLCTDGLTKLYNNEETTSKRTSAYHTSICRLNQLLNIAEYYNRLHTIATNPHTIIYNKVSKTYYTSVSDSMYSFGIKAYFNREEDAQAVIDNPNFREILDTIYK